MSVGWIVVSFFTMAIALSMAEIVSAIPTAGGPYYWAAILAPPKHSAFASWITGWYVRCPRGPYTRSPQLPCVRSLMR
jgi:amino acid transporter